MTNHGYSIRLVQANNSANIAHPGVLLGRECIARDISVTTVANTLDVTRQTVYLWFTGSVEPRKRQAIKIREFLSGINSYRIG